MKTQYDLYNDGIGSVDYIQHVGSDITIVNAARVSFNQEKTEVDASDEKLIKYLIKNRHTSTLEHNSVTFRFTVPLFIRSQHHRHRTWSYNEVSRRYTQEDIQFYEPMTFRTQHKSNRQASNVDEINPYLERYAGNTSVVLQTHNKQALELFDNMLDNGVCREQARGVLPQSMYTKYYGTVNLNNLIKFIDLRDSDHAQWEIQKVAQACQSIAEEIWPITMNAYKDIKKG